MFSHNEVIKEIRNLNVVAKTVSALSNHNNFNSPDRILFLLMQLKDPAYFRPTKDRKISITRDKQIQFKNRKLTIRPKNNMFFTKKTATTLLPEDGRINLYMPHKKHPIGLLFRLSDCHTKAERYIFPCIAETDKGDNRHLHPTISLKKLRYNLQNSQSIPDANELDIGLSLQSLIGIFAPQNDAYTIALAKQTQTLILNTFNLSLPLFLITPAKGIVPIPFIPRQTYHPTYNLSKVIPDVLNLVITYLTAEELGRLAIVNKSFTKQLKNHAHFYYCALARDIPMLIPRNQGTSREQFILSLYLKSFQGLVTSDNFKAIKELAMQHPDFAQRLLVSEYYSAVLPKEEKIIANFSSIDAFKLGLFYCYSLLIIGIFTLMSLVLAFTIIGTGGASLVLCAPTSFCREILGATLSPIIAFLSTIFIITDYSLAYGFSYKACSDTLNLLISTIFTGSPGGYDDPWVYHREMTIDKTICPGYLEARIKMFFMRTVVQAANQPKTCSSWLLKVLEEFFLNVKSKSENELAPVVFEAEKNWPSFA